MLCFTNSKFKLYQQEHETFKEKMQEEFNKERTICRSPQKKQDCDVLVNLGWLRLGGVVALVQELEVALELQADKREH